MTRPLSCYGGNVSVTTGQSSSNGSKRRKVVHFMRHGTTEMNVFLTKNPYGSLGFKDPLLYDTRLTPAGAAGARRAAALTAMLMPEPEVLLVSPLTRALQTAALAFPHYGGKVEVEALARERVYLSSDCGRSSSQLVQDASLSRFSFKHLPDIWWYNGDSSDPKHIVYEPDSVFKERVAELQQLLLSRSESCIAMVAHWGLLHELTGYDFDNCEKQIRVVFMAWLKLMQTPQIQSFELIEAGFTSLQNPLL